jgi:2-haloacid dehalogenase
MENSSNMTVEAKTKRPVMVFDLGGVLIDWNPRYLYRKIFHNDEERVDTFLTTVYTPDWNAQMDCGYPFETAVKERCRLYPDQAEYIRAYWERWDETISGEISGTVDILAVLHEAGYPLYILSNWSAESFARVREKFPFLKWFDGAVISGQVRMLKPNKNIFDYLLWLAGCKAEECLFIDDHLNNTEAADTFGFQTILFTSPEELKKELQGKKILSAG